MTQLNVLYFAWVRERIGVAKEQVSTDAKTVDALIAELSGREDRYQLAFQDMNVVKVAIDQVLVPLDASLSGAKEVAFFPPMTGG
jgi:molybdopterin synthase sulfur carrier subunit